MKKLLVLAAIAGAAYLVYRQMQASRAEEDLWSEATAAPDFSQSYTRTEPSPAVVAEADAADVVAEAEAAKDDQN